MHSSKRSRRMQRNHERHGKAPGINMVSLMDIFTILVFFLLVNSASDEVLPGSGQLVLPDSTSDLKGRPSLLVRVGPDSININDQAVTGNDPKAWQGAFANWLAQQPEADKAAITIMGGKDIDYARLRSVMKTATESGFARVSLAVVQKAPPEV